MLEIVSEKINAYIERQYHEDDPVLEEMLELGRKREFPIVGPQVGRMLSILTHLAKAQRVFEIGSGFGYSAYWFARALPDSGKVYQTEGFEDNAALSRDFFKRGGLSAKTEIMVGDGLELIHRVNGTFDIIFMDLQKENYPAAFKIAEKRLNPGGLLLADNTLWFGKVLDDERRDLETLGIREFTKLLFESPDFFSTILPIRDGVAVGYKIS